MFGIQSNNFYNPFRRYTVKGHIFFGIYNRNFGPNIWAHNLRCIWYNLLARARHKYNMFNRIERIDSFLCIDWANRLINDNNFRSGCLAKQAHIHLYRLYNYYKLKIMNCTYNNIIHKSLFVQSNPLSNLILRTKN